MSNIDVRFMEAALAEAKISAAADEVPVGAVIVRDGVIIASSGNLRESDRDATCHAEICAIRKACAALGGWRLCGCDLYVTLEPCAMCAGAVINARIDNLIFGATDKRFGAAGSIVDLFGLPFNHHVNVTGGVLEDDCAEILSEYFRKKR